MKNIFSVTIGMAIIIFVAACDNNNTEQKLVSEKKNDTLTQTVEHHQEEEGNSLSLNNGAKWKADSITNANVGQLFKIVDNSKPASLNDYKQLGYNILDAINKLLKDCKMKGADHEALHHWLEPLLKKNDVLIKSSSLEQAQQIFTEEKQHLNLYHKYFE